MKKGIFFFIFLIFPSILFSQEINNNKNYCNFILNEINGLENIYPKIELIEVKVNKNKNWTVNSLKIATGNFRFIPDQYKKRFNSTIIVNYENNLTCKYKGSVRFSGDQKDHVDLNLKENFINQSIDVSLKNGHINGIVKFKLLLQRTRGADEILVSEIFKELGYLAPRTSIINAKINGVTSKMIFQEKSRKELLESNYRREGPILEGDERFTWMLSQKVPLDNRSNREAGLLELAKIGFKSILAKQINSRLILKNNNLKMMSYNSLSNLNLIYLKYANSFEKDTRYLESYRYHTLDNKLLGFNKKANIIFLDIYNLLVMSSSDGHSLAPNNRQFYWNSIQNFFEPISYDGNFDIFKSPNLLIKPTSNYFLESISTLDEVLNNLNIKNLNTKLNQNGIIEDIDITKKKIEKLKKNLEEVKIKYLSDSSVKNVSIKSNEEDLKNYNWENLIDNTKKIEPKVLFIKQKKDNSFLICKNINNCVATKFSKKQIREMLDGDLKIDGNIYQFLGKNINDISLINDFNFKLFKIQNSKFYFSEGIEFNFNSENNILNIYQKNLSGKAFLLGGLIQDLKINFYGYINKDYYFSNTFIPSDINGLTGCLSLINIDVKNISIEVYNSNCEDGLNLINTKGTVSNIKIENSFSDAFDADFSKVVINNLNIKKSQNDCADFSYGEYKLLNSNFDFCGDKSLSVGEKSILSSNLMKVTNSKIGIASKDSSVVNLENGNFNKVEYCLMAYNKKQEFFGGFITFNKLNCENYSSFFEIDMNSRILNNDKDIEKEKSG